MNGALRARAAVRPALRQGARSCLGAGRRLGRAVRCADAFGAGALTLGFAEDCFAVPARPLGRHWGCWLRRFWGADLAERLPALRTGCGGGGTMALAGPIRPGGGSGLRPLVGSAVLLRGGGRRRSDLLFSGRDALLAAAAGWAAALPARKPGMGTLLPAAWPPHWAGGSGQSGARPAGAGGGRLRRRLSPSAARERALRWRHWLSAGRRCGSGQTLPLRRRLPGSAPRGRQPCGSACPGAAGGGAGRLRGRLRGGGALHSAAWQGRSASAQCGGGLGGSAPCCLQWLMPGLKEDRPSPATSGRRLSCRPTRLEAVAESLSSLAETVNEVYDAFPRRCEDFRWVIDNTHDTLCANCGRREVCWKQEYAATLEGMEALRPILEENRAIWKRHFCPGSCPGASTRRRSAPRLPRPLRSTAAGEEAHVHAEALRTALTEQYSAVADALGVLSEQLGRPGTPEPYKSGRVSSFLLPWGPRRWNVPLRWTIWAGPGRR